MLPILKSDRRPQKCQTTATHLPAYIDASQPPQKRKPFDALWAMHWCHTVDVLLPAELRDVIIRTEARQVELGRLKARNDRYAKVIMKLGDVLEGGFFNEYIKKGDVMILSEGRPGVDTVYQLRDGILHIEVDTPTYERLGLVGIPIRDGGRRHKKNRYAIELNLRLPSMLHGKKGFDRLVWACKNVLNHSVTWLFYDCRAVDSAGEGAAPIDPYHPLWHTIKPTSTQYNNVLIPPLTHDSVPIPTQTQTTRQHSIDDINTTTHLADLSEYLSLLALSSPRVLASDRPDPLISRYSVPDPAPATAPSLGSKSNPSPPPAATTTGSIVRLRYHGFIPAAYVVRLFVLLSKGLDSHEASAKDDQEKSMSKSDAWGAVLAEGFGGGAVSVLRLSGSPRDGDGGVRNEDEVDMEEGVGVVEAAALADGAEEGDDEGKNQDEDVSMAEGDDGRAAADAGEVEEDNMAEGPALKSGKEGIRPKSAKEGARIICWEYPAPPR